MRKQIVQYSETRRINESPSIEVNPIFIPITESSETVILLDSK